jgi:hypothetical protein
MGYEGTFCLLGRLTFDLEGLANASRQVETPNGAERQEAHRSPHGKRATWSGNQLLPKATKDTKNIFLIRIPVMLLI